MRSGSRCIKKPVMDMNLGYLIPMIIHDKMTEFDNPKFNMAMCYVVYKLILNMSSSILFLLFESKT